MFDTLYAKGLNAFSFITINSMQCMYKYNRFTLMSQDLHILLTYKTHTFIVIYKRRCKVGVNAAISANSYYFCFKL